MEQANQNAAVDVAVNPLSAAISAQIETKLVEPKEVAFHFRKDKELGDESKRPTFKANIPLLTKAGVIAALQADDKSTQLILEAANNVIIDRMRGLIGEKIENDTFNKDTKKWGITLSIEDFNMEDLSFLKIATLPKSERGAGIPKEAWAAFVADYIETMQKPEAVALFADKKQRNPDVLQKHGIILGGKFNAVRSRKEVIQQMLGFLDVWAQVSPNLEEHQAAYEHLLAKGQVLLQGESFEDL